MADEEAEEEEEKREKSTKEGMREEGGQEIQEKLESSEHPEAGLSPLESPLRQKRHSGEMEPSNEKGRHSLTRFKSDPVRDGNIPWNTKAPISGKPWLLGQSCILDAMCKNARMTGLCKAGCEEGRGAVGYGHPSDSIGERSPPVPGWEWRRRSCPGDRHSLGSPLEGGLLLGWIVPRGSECQVRGTTCGPGHTWEWQQGLRTGHGYPQSPFSPRHTAAARGLRVPPSDLVAQSQGRAPSREQPTVPCRGPTGMCGGRGAGRGVSRDTQLPSRGSAHMGSSPRPSGPCSVQPVRMAREPAGGQGRQGHAAVRACGVVLALASPAPEGSLT